MSDAARGSDGIPAKSDLERELGRAEYEPLLPIEKKLIGWSLGLGITLLVLLAIVGRLYPV